MRADVAANGRDSEDSDSRVSQAALVSRVSPAGQQPRASRISVARTSVRPRRIPRGISFFLGGSPGGPSETRSHCEPLPFPHGGQKRSRGWWGVPTSSTSTVVASGRSRSLALCSMMGHL